MSEKDFSWFNSLDERILLCSDCGADRSCGTQCPKCKSTRAIKVNPINTYILKNTGDPKMVDFSLHTNRLGAELARDEESVSAVNDGREKV